MKIEFGGSTYSYVSGEVSPLFEIFKIINERDIKDVSHCKFINLELKIDLSIDRWKVDLVGKGLDVPLFSKVCYIDHSSGRIMHMPTWQRRPLNKDEILEFLEKNKENIYNLFKLDKRVLYKQVKDPQTSVSLLKHLLCLDLFNKNKFIFSANFEDVSPDWHNPQYIKNTYSPFNIEITLHLDKNSDIEYKEIFSYSPIGTIKINVANIFNNNEYFDIKYSGKKRQIDYIFEYNATDSFKKARDFFIKTANDEIEYLQQFI